MKQLKCLTITILSMILFSCGTYIKLTNEKFNYEKIMIDSTQSPIEILDKYSISADRFLEDNQHIITPGKIIYLDKATEYKIKTGDRIYKLLRERKISSENFLKKNPKFLNKGDLIYLHIPSMNKEFVLKVKKAIESNEYLLPQKISATSATFVKSSDYNANESFFTKHDLIRIYIQTDYNIKTAEKLNPSNYKPSKDYLKLSGIIKFTNITISFIIDKPNGLYTYKISNNTEDNKDRLSKEVEEKILYILENTPELQ